MKIPPSFWWSFSEHGNFIEVYAKHNGQYIKIHSFAHPENVADRAIQQAQNLISDLESGRLNLKTLLP